MNKLAELIAAAQAAVLAGNVEEGERLYTQAKTLKGILELDTAQPSPEAEGLRKELEELKAFKAKIEAEPATSKAGHITVIKDEDDKKLEENPFKSIGAFLMSVKEYAQGRRTDERLRALRSEDPMDEGGFNMTKAVGAERISSLVAAREKATKAAAGMNEGVPSAGGFLVGTSVGGLMERVYNVGQLLQRVSVTPLSGNNNSMIFYAEDEASRADGYRRGGVRGYWIGEAQTLTASRPKFREIALKLKKAAALVYCTDELLADASALEAYISRNLPEELRFIVEDSLVNGAGGGRPLGFMNSDALITVPKEVGQGAATIVAQNIIKMWARRWVGASDYVWLVSQDTTPSLHTMGLSVGTGGQLLYMPPGGLSAAPYGTLMGRPVIETEYNEAVGTEGDIVLASLSQIEAIDKGGIQSASSIHVNFVTDETAFRFIYRFDAEPTWNTPLTPKNGGATVSPYVALATRS